MTVADAKAAKDRGRERFNIYSDPICPWYYIGRRHMRVALDNLAWQGLWVPMSWRPFRLNPETPPGGLPRAEYCRAKFGDIGDDSVLADAAAAVGMDRASACAYLAGDAGRAEVEQGDTAARRAGLQVVPAFVVRNRALFAGAVPADAFADGLARACMATLPALRRQARCEYVADHDSR